MLLHRASQTAKKCTRRIEKRLDIEVDNLILQGVTDFISGGALGFDQIAASLIIAKRKQRTYIRLIFALPCINQDEHWNDMQKRQYVHLLTEADEIIYVSRVDNVAELASF